MGRAFIQGYGNVTQEDAANFRIEIYVSYFKDDGGLVPFNTAAVMAWDSTPTQFKDAIVNSVIASVDPSWGTLTKQGILMPDFTRGT